MSALTAALALIRRGVSELRKGILIPIQDGVARRYPATITWATITVNTIVFLFQTSLSPAALERFVAVFGLIPARYFGHLAALSPPQSLFDYLPFVSNIFLHGGWMHLVLNMWTLWIFGPAVEDRLGSVRFLIFYLLCGIAASFAHAIFDASSVVPSLGASGAIAGVIGCYVRLFPFARLVMIIPVFIFPFFVEVYAIFFALFWFMTQIIPGIFSLMLPPTTGGIAWWAHVGGFMAGWMITPWVRRSERNYRRFYADEGRYGFFPNGSRSRGGQRWL